MAKDVAGDVGHYREFLAGSVGKEKRVSEEKLEGLEKHITEDQQHQQKELSRLEAEIIACFQLGLGESADTLLRRLKEQDPVVVDLFRKGKWSWARDDWSELEGIRVISPKDRENLKRLYKEYVSTSIHLKQSQKVLYQIRRIKHAEGDKETEVAKLGTLLQQKRYFDPDTHPLAPAMMMIEDELRIVLTDRQVINFCNVITHHSSFIHEVWGGGKTTVLRHLITKFLADGGYAASLLTHAPLFEEHHEQLKEATASFYGQQAYRTKFSRSSPTDPVAIRREYLKLVNAVEGKGRIDQTIDSYLSTRHAFNFGILGLKEVQEGEKAFARVSAMGQFLLFRQETTNIESDELEAVCTPDLQHIYATGTSVNLPAEVYEPALEMMRLLNTKPYAQFRPYFVDKEKNLGTMPEKLRTEMVGMLAHDIAKKYGIELSEKQWIDYFSPLSSASPEAVQKKKEIYQAFSAGENAKYVQSVAILLGSILPISFQTKTGVNYGRSADGVHTKPCSSSGVCAETSEHGSAHLMVLYTCLDFFKNGIGSGPSGTLAIKTFISHLREANAKEALSQPGLETQIEIQFRERFGIELHKVTEDDFLAIAALINQSDELKIWFLKVANFEHATSYNRRLEGNAKQVGRDVAEICGSSGNSERVRTLPQKVALIPELMRQKGTMGSIFYNMLKDWKEDSIVPVEAGVSFEQFAAKHLKPGSALIDAAPFFAGDKPEESVAKIAKAQPGIPIRYFDSKGAPMVHTVDGKDIPDDGLIPPEQCITLFSHADRRGRDRALPKRSEHVMTVSYDTTLSDFSQGGMRARGWGKGQTIRYLVDEGCQTRCAEFKGVSKPTQLAAMLIRNEVAKLKKLHTMATTQEILSIGDAAVQRMLREAKNLKEVIAIRDACLAAGYIEQSSEVNMSAMSAPRLPTSANEYFASRIATERSRLEQIRAKINESVPSAAEAANKAIDEALEQLSNQKLVMEKKYLEPTIAGESLDTVAEVEVQAQVEQQVEQEVSQDVAIAVEMEAEVSVEDEVRERRPEPMSGGAAYSFSSPCWLGEVSIPNSYQKTGWPGSIYFGYLSVLGKGYGLWIEGKADHQQVLAPSVLLIYDTVTHEMKAVMGSIKDADLAFEPYASSKPEGKIVVHYKLDDRRPIEKVLQDFGDQTQAAIEKIACAKLLYAGDVTLSDQEQKALPSITEAQYNLLKKYLETFFPEGSRKILGAFNSWS